MIKPDYEFFGIGDIPEDFLKKEGIRYLLIDIDNTLVADNAPDADENSARFLKKLEDNNIPFYLVSNNSRERVESFNRNFGYNAIFKAGKPLPAKLLKVMAQMGAQKSETALIGDQIFTDLLAAKFSGIRMILVNPINTEIETRFFKFKRFWENVVYKRRIK